jgi:hypothetical protein
MKVTGGLRGGGVRRASRTLALVVLAVAVTAAPVIAQSGGGFDLSWNTIDGGGGTSTNGAFVCSGTAGQPDASSANGGDFQLAGGFWAGVVAPGTVCIGDCNNDGDVTVDDLLLMVNIALGLAPFSDCPEGDSSGDGMITIEDILVAVNHALSGC